MTNIVRDLILAVAIVGVILWIGVGSRTPLNCITIGHVMELGCG